MSNRCAMVAPATTTTVVTAEAWATDFTEQRDNEIGKCTRRHLTEFCFSYLPLFFSPKAHRVVLDNVL
jgi:hypothetical protein